MADTRLANTQPNGRCSSKKTYRNSHNNLPRSRREDSFLQRQHALIGQGAGPPSPNPWELYKAPLEPLGALEECDCQIKPLGPFNHRPVNQTRAYMQSDFCVQPENLHTCQGRCSTPWLISQRSTSKGKSLQPLAGAGLLAFGGKDFPSGIRERHFSWRCRYATSTWISFD